MACTYLTSCVHIQTIFKIYFCCWMFFFRLFFFFLREVYTSIKTSASLANSSVQFANDQGQNLSITTKYTLIPSICTSLKSFYFFDLKRPKTKLLLVF